MPTVAAFRGPCSKQNKPVKSLEPFRIFRRNFANILILTNKKSEMSFFKSNGIIHKKEDGLYHVVSANEDSSVTL